ncbi:hypothetical protein, partial [Agromyces humi]|uniref:hypothetical protein n=1 Tax=Agromyces humi TaxID=1766800 RepID=UPI00193A9DDF
DRVEVVQVNGKDALRVVDLKTGKEKTAWDRNRYGDDHGDQIRTRCSFGSSTKTSVARAT